ncbi:MAG: DUF1003 domain-containing protein [Streptosporangiales bacterium]|nr:DUF1003 domain-containing protein [Streptosporangiales bacterium]
MSETGEADGQQPVKSADNTIGLNGALGAALTRAVGSMPALYGATVFIGLWMVAGTWGPLHSIDPYPFPFLLFLNNVVQLLLCSVILVGQRVLGAAADRRSVQTYESTETIFDRVADLQAHLDRHDRTLSHGLSLLDSSPHPWVEQHRVQPPPQAAGQVTGANGKIAAWMTERLGSMWAFYAAFGTQVIWIGLAAAGVQRFDPYPFEFMTLLSTLVQLIFMITIMVGQDVMGRAGDQRAEQTFLDAEAILHECGRMKARLTAQDRVIGRLAGYAADHVTDHLARAIHQTAVDDGIWSRDWRELPGDARNAYRLQARRLGERLAGIGCLMVPTAGVAAAFSFTDAEAELLARSEHDYWRAESTVHDALDDPGPHSGDPDLLPWDRLPAAERERRIGSVRQIPRMLAQVGFQVLREGTAPDETGPDFTAGEWDVLHRALMAAGVLVALAEGAAEPDEIYALVRKLRQASISHPNRLVRELASSTAFDTGLRPGTGYDGYQAPALKTVRSAAVVVAGKAADDLESFRGFLDEITAAVADADNEGGVLGLGARPRTPSEVAAMDAVRVAADPDGPLPVLPRSWGLRRVSWQSIG